MNNNIDIGYTEELKLFGQFLKQNNLVLMKSIKPEIPDLSLPENVISSFKLLLQDYIVGMSTPYSHKDKELANSIRDKNNYLRSQIIEFYEFHIQDNKAIKENSSNTYYGVYGSIDIFTLQVNETMYIVSMSPVFTYTYDDWGREKTERLSFGDDGYAEPPREAVISSWNIHFSTAINL